MGKLLDKQKEWLETKKVLVELKDQLLDSFMELSEKPDLHGSHEIANKAFDMIEVVENAIAAGDAE
jgi:hypothetical protein